LLLKLRKADLLVCFSKYAVSDISWWVRFLFYLTTFCFMFNFLWFLKTFFYFWFWRILYRGRGSTQTEIYFQIIFELTLLHLLCEHQFFPNSQQAKPCLPIGIGPIKSNLWTVKFYPKFLGNYTNIYRNILIFTSLNLHLQIQSYIYEYRLVNNIHEVKKENTSF